MTSPSAYVPEGVSPLPWEVREDSWADDVWIASEGDLDGGCAIVSKSGYREFEKHRANAAYIAHAANTLPQALALLERLMDGLDDYWADETAEGIEAAAAARALILSARQFAEGGK